METLSPTPGLHPEAKGRSGRTPRTPPYTPHRTKRTLSRSDSPASIRSIQPAETSSPAKKKGAKRRNVVVADNVRVEELREGDAGYATDADVVYPDALEEAGSEAGGGAADDEQEEEVEYAAGRLGEDVYEESDTGISQRFERLGCEDTRAEEVEFEKMRREKRRRKRTDSRVFKRSHSQSVKEGGVGGGYVDADAMDDQDLSGSARRLRRRVDDDDSSIPGLMGRNSLSPSTRHRMGTGRPEASTGELQGQRRSVENDDNDDDDKTDSAYDDNDVEDAMDIQ